MSIRTAMEEAFQRGEKIKDQVIDELINSQTINNLLSNELFINSLTKVLNTKYELKRAFKTNFRTMLKAFNVPTRDEINAMERKIHRLETELDGIHRKILTSRLGSAQKKTGTKRAAPKKSAAKTKAKAKTKGS